MTYMLSPFENISGPSWLNPAPVKHNQGAAGWDDDFDCYPRKSFQFVDNKKRHLKLWFSILLVLEFD